MSSDVPKKKISKVVDFILVSYSIITMIAVFILLFYSLKYWQNNFPLSYPLEAKLFYVAVGVTIVTVLAQWIEGRLKAILRIMKGGKKDGRDIRRRNIRVTKEEQTDSD